MIHDKTGFASGEREGSGVSRRAFVGAAMGLIVANAYAATPPIPIIDTHIHLFDPSRPQGVPWPTKDNSVLYHPALPARYRKIAGPLGIVGAIEVEASPWLEDNQWVLDIAAKDTIIVGTVGDLEPGQSQFRSQLERFQRNPLFRGIRYGNLWGRNLGAQLGRHEFISDLKVLSEADLVLDTANPNPALIADIVRLSDLVPDLRIVIDHLPQLEPPVDAKAHGAYEANLRELGTRPHIYVKISEVLRRVDGRVPQTLEFYRPRLDELWGIFGSERLLYGSDWPNSDQWGTYAQVLDIVLQYFSSKGTAVAERYFWKNSVAAYRWVKRDATQPSLA